MTELTTNGRAVRQALLVIADIRGYTPFMKAHWTSLAHAQDVVARLLEAVIDVAPSLTPLEIEGDAAFFYAWAEGAERAAPARLLEHPRFRAAYDFLLLRAAAGEVEQELAQWWTDIQPMSVEQRTALVEQTGDGQEATPGASGPRRRRRRRRRAPPA